MNRKSKNAMKVVLEVFIIPFVILTVWAVLSLFFSGCKDQVIEPKPLDISGVYQSVDYDGEFHNGYDIKLFLIHEGNHLSGIGQFDTSTFSIDGVMKGKEVLITLTLIYQGYIYQCHFDLFYEGESGYYPLVGGFTMNGTKAIRFKYEGALEKSMIHNQGRIFTQ